MFVDIVKLFLIRSTVSVALVNDGLKLEDCRIALVVKALQLSLKSLLLIIVFVLFILNTRL